MRATAPDSQPGQPPLLVFPFWTDDSEVFQAQQFCRGRMDLLTNSLNTHMLLLQASAFSKRHGHLNSML